MKTRRIACHEVIADDNSRQPMTVVEIESGYVTRCYPFIQELPFTEWLQGTVELKRDSQGLLLAYYKGNRIE